MDKVVTCHIENFKVKPELIAEVPGVCTLMGAFSDFCKGFCITGTGALGLRIALSRNDDSSLVHLFDATRKDRKQFSVNNLKYRKEDKWANYIKGVFSVLVSEGFSLPAGLDITLKGALLYCDSLTVSVSITVGLMLALTRYLSLDLDNSAIIRLSYIACTRFSNVKVRLRDIITLMNAEAGKVLFFDLQSMDYESVDYPFSNAAENGAYGMILDPQVPPQILREELEEKREEAHDCCEKLEALLPAEYRIRSYPVSELKSHMIKELSEHERRTCEYVISESLYTQKGLAALKDGDAATFARCLRDIYISMRDVFEITCPEVDWLIKRASETEGIYGASLVSNGATGSLYMILEQSGENSYKKHMEDYHRIFDFLPQTRIYYPGGSARVLDNIEC